jgi:hypothetical protein
MSKGVIIRWTGAAALALFVAGAWFVASANKERRYVMFVLSMSVGADLVHTNYSRSLTGVTPELQADLNRVLASPTRCIVRSGDERPPLGDGQAYTRLLLTNEAGQALTLRLRPEYDGHQFQKFRVLGYWKTEPGGPANRSQPVRSETNQTSAAAGSGG